MIGPQLRFTLRRLVLTIPVLLVMSIIVFLVLRLVPGDPVTAMLGMRATPANVAQVRSDLGLDKPLWVQYGAYLGRLLHGNMGRDYTTNAPVSGLLASHLPVTAQLAVLAMALALAIGVPLGVLSGSRPRSWLHRATTGYVAICISVPEFWLGLMLVIGFAAVLHWLPPSGYVPLSQNPGETLRHLALPVLALALGQSAYVMRTTSAAVEEVMGRNFIVLLRAKGVRHRRILFRHALRSAAVSIVTVVGVQVGMLLGGAIAVETIFGLPGLGSLVVNAVSQRNYVVVQGAVLVIGAMFVLTNLVTDVIVGWLDPRVAEGGQG